MQERVHEWAIGLARALAVTWALAGGLAACTSADSDANKSGVDAGLRGRADAGYERIDGAPPRLNDAGKPYEAGPYDCPAKRCSGSAPVCWGDIYCCEANSYECQGLPPECAAQPSCACLVAAESRRFEDGGSAGCFGMDCWEYDGGFYIECERP